MLRTKIPRRIFPTERSNNITYVQNVTNKNYQICISLRKLFPHSLYQYHQHSQTKYWKRSSGWHSSRWAPLFIVRHCCTIRTFFLDTRNISPRTYLEKRNHIVFFPDLIFSPRIYPAPSPRYLVSRILRHAWKYARNFQDFVS